jgi:hypothetical protein
MAMALKGEDPSPQERTNSSNQLHCFAVAKLKNRKYFPLGDLQSPQATGRQCAKPISSR